MKKYERVKALVSLDAIAHNFEEMHRNVKEGTRIIAVIKADGYGHGARAIAKLIHDYDYIWGFATATAEEALELRHAGITKPILILGIVFEEYYEELAANDIRITISDLNTAVEYAKAGERIGKNVHIHLALDTGMTRIGYADIPENAVKIEKVAKIPNLVIEGMFTHFARQMSLTVLLHLCSLTVICVLQIFWKKGVCTSRSVTAPTVQVSSVFRKPTLTLSVQESPFMAFILPRRLSVTL